MSCGRTRQELDQLLKECTSTSAFLYEQHFYEESKDGLPCTYCKACRTKGHPGKIIADHPAKPSEEIKITFSPDKATTAEDQEFETPPMKKPRCLIMPVASATAPCGISASNLLIEVWKTLTTYHSQLDVPEEEEANKLWPEAMTLIEVIFIRQNVDDQRWVTTSFTRINKDYQPPAISSVFYCPQDPNTLVEARFVHEVTHALRFALAFVANSKRGDKMYALTTPQKLALSTDMSTKYKLNKDRPHSGYLVEHALRDGITVLLTGLIKDDSEGDEGKGIITHLEKPKLVTIQKVENTTERPMFDAGRIGDSWKQLHLSNGKSIRHCGEIITRSGHARVL